MSKVTIDDITLVTALLCDDRITLDECIAERHPQKKAIAAHCSWTLNAEMELDELEKLIVVLKSSAEKKQWSFYCEDCGAEWLELGACNPDCAALGPSFYLFDDRKGQVIQALRDARQELANERGEGKLYVSKQRA